MKRFVLTAGAMALAFSAQAQQADVDGGAVELGEVVVLGQTESDAEKTGKAYTIITGQQLQQRQIRYVADALRQVPGFSVSRTGSYGGLTQVRVRGAEANHLLVMVDGVEASETLAGEFDFGSLLVTDIDRIEVLRGPQSAFWGSNATAGVVNIVTRRGQRDGFKLDTRTEGGTDGTFLGGVTLSGGGDNYDMALSAAFRRNDGFNISDESSEKDGDRNVTLNGKVNVDLTPDLKLDGTLRFVDRTSDYDPQGFDGIVHDGDDQTATRELFGSVGATYVSLDNALTQRFRLTGSDITREDTANDLLKYRYDGDRLNASYQASYEFDTPGFLGARHVVTGGYEWERERFRANHLSETEERATNSFVGEYRGEFLDQIYLTAALRHDLNDDFRDATTYSLSAAWKIPGTATRLHASVGTGVTNPSFFEQFGYDPGTFVGNPNLVPERSFGWDIGVEQKFFDDALTVDLTYFNQNLTDEIGTDYSNYPVTTPYNMDGVSKRHGVEIAATLALASGLSANATYTYTDATEQSTAGGPRLEELRRPKHSGSLGLAYVFYEDRARVFADATFNGKMKDMEYVTFPYDRVTLGSYTVVNVGGSFKFSEKLEGFARVENLFDEKYEEVFGYNTAGRTAFVGLKGSF